MHHFLEFRPKKPTQFKCVPGKSNRALGLKFLYIASGNDNKSAYQIADTPCSFAVAWTHIKLSAWAKEELATSMNKDKNPPQPSPSPKASDVPSLGEIGLTQFLPYLFNRIASSWNSDQQEDFRKQNLNAFRMRVLAVLSIKDGLSVSELIHLTVIEQSTISRTLDALEDAAMIQKVPSEEDRRVRVIRITDKGRSTFQGLWPDMYGNYEVMLKGVSEEELSALIRTLQKILRNVSDRD